MSPDDILYFTRRQPFTPIRIHATDGRSYEVRHPDRILVLRTRLHLAVGGNGRAAERVEHLALMHVVRVEELDTPPSEQRV